MKTGEVGTVVELLAADVYEVEFCDDLGQTNGELRTARPPKSSSTQSRRTVERCCLALQLKLAIFVLGDFASLVKPTDRCRNRFVVCVRKHL
ncbi:MAG: DUF4926 domain-containing protein [Deltaproteobacteria bacterium]|nr:DUF4926 domain-containing protein [Deltaproteobacteria bacterium]MBM4298846.1 DUF4926 domain-containing protein [Deltaproteobacteria bacterium]